MINQIFSGMLDPLIDDVLTKMLTEDYADNPFVMATIAQKLTPGALIEAGIRAETGKALSRPIGSPLVLSPWEKILLNPRQLFQFPTSNLEEIDTKAVIGPRAKKPLLLDLPVMITGMSYGGSLSLPMKIALAKGAAMAGTATNTGESAVTNEERDSAKFLIGQYNRGRWLNEPGQLKRLDAIEVQLGQGAFGGAVNSTVKAKDIDEHLRDAWKTERGEDATIYSRFPNINSTDELVNLIKELKNDYEVPVGIKIAGTDFIEYELEVVAKTEVDFIVVDGAEGGTAAAPPTLEDHVGLPTLHSLVRTVDWLEERHLRDRISVIAAGGLKTPGHFLKALAIGADAVYIGSIAIAAALQTQMNLALPKSPVTQVALQSGRLKEKLDVEKAARHLANFLQSCSEEMKLAAQALGKESLSQLGREDLVTVSKDLAEFMGIRYAASHRRRSSQEIGETAEEKVPVTIQ